MIQLFCAAQTAGRLISKQYNTYRLNEFINVLVINVLQQYSVDSYGKVNYKNKM